MGAEKVSETQCLRRSRHVSTGSGSDPGEGSPKTLQSLNAEGEVIVKFNKSCSACHHVG